MVLATALFAIGGACLQAGCKTEQVEPVSTVAPMPDDWLPLCRTTRDSGPFRPSSAVVFSDPPEDAVVPATWSLNVSGTEVPIPAISYTDVQLECSDPGGRPSVSLAAGNQYVLVFTLSKSDLPDPLATDGGTVVQAELMEMAFQHEPGELTCRPERWEQEAHLGLAMQLKAQVEYPAIHRTDGGWVGALELGPGQRAWEVTLPGDQVWTRVEYQVDPAGDLRDIGLAWVRGGQAAADPPPEWLGTLAAAMTSADACENWKFTPPAEP